MSNNYGNTHYYAVASFLFDYIDRRGGMLQVAVLCLGSVGAVVAMLVNSRLPGPYMVGPCPPKHTTSCQHTMYHLHCRP